MSPGVQILLTSAASILVPLAVAWFTLRGTKTSKESDRTIAAEARSAQAQQDAYDALQEDLTEARKDAAATRAENATLRAEMDATAKQARGQVDEMWKSLRDYRAEVEAQMREYQSQTDQREKLIKVLQAHINAGLGPPPPSVSDVR